MKQYKDTEYFIDENGNIYRNNKIRKPKKSSGMPYYQIDLWKKGKCEIKYIHRIVAETFIPNPDNKPFVNHKNTIKTDNRVENLEWVSPKENTNHAKSNGLMDFNGEKNPQSKLTKEQIIQIKKEYVRNSRTFGSTALSKKYNVCFQQIIRIVNGERWGWLV
jgi:hypothetical protein